MMRTLVVAVTVCCIVSWADTTLYVATDGNDAWTGTLEAPNADASDGPLASIEGARDAIRSLRKADRLTAPVNVLVAEGTYALEDTLVLSAEDSGTADAPITYRAIPGACVVLTGGRVVGGWHRDAGGAWVTSLPEQGCLDFRFRELFFQGERQVLARYPNFDPEHPVTGGMLYVDDTAARSKNSFHYKEGSIPFDRWPDLAQAEVNIHPYNCWDHNILRVAKIDQDMNLIRLRHGVAGEIFVGNRYFVQNVLGALDAPGEWFSDWRTGAVHFRSPTGAAPGDSDVVVPVLENIVQFSGADDEPVEHIRFHGFELRYARQDAITLEGARNCAITGNTISRVGGVGVNVGYLRNAIKGVGLPWRKSGSTRVNIHSGDRSLVFSHLCSECRIAGNDIDSTGGEGVALGGTSNVADNNHISRTGTYDRVCAGITICGDENVASHNVIHDVPRDGIFINGKLNTAEYNEIRNSMLYTADNAAIALRQHDVGQAVKNRGNVLRYNRLLDTVGYGSYPHCTHPGDGFASPFCGFGIYLDGSISGVTVYGNIISRCGGNSLFIQFGGGNVVHNNIFVEGDAERTQFDAMVFFGTFMYPDKQANYRDQEPPNAIKHNIFYYAGPDTKLYQVGHWDNAPEWNRKQAVFDSNLIWHKGQPVAVCMHKKTMDCKSLQQWQAQGYDTASIVADPLFVNASKDDYRLKPGSPAYDVGFTDINPQIEKIGAYESDERASWPLTAVLLEREPPVLLAFSKEPRPLVDGFELTPPGFPPAKCRAITHGAAGLLVSDELPKTGAHSLKFTDAAGLDNVWEPHVAYAPAYGSGKLHFAIDIFNTEDRPADYYVEFRDWAGDLLVGPTFRATGDGAFYVNGRLGSGGREIARVPKGEWYNVAIDFELGDDAPREYTLTLSVPGREDLVDTLPIVDDRFRNVTWFGISSLSAESTVFYVDNLILGPAESEKVMDAAGALTIKGTGKARPGAMATMRNPNMVAGSWSFDGVGVDLVDSSWNGLDGDLGGAVRATGDFGSGLYLEGAGATAVFPDSPLLQFGTGDFSIECWLYPVRMDVSSEHKRRRIIDKCAFPTSWWNVDLWTDGRLQMEMADASATVGTTTSAGAIPEQAWTHVAITVDRTNFRTSYFLNGKLDSVRPLPPGFTSNLNVSGVPLSTGTWQQFIGVLDDLSIHKRLLAEDEIADSYERAKGRHLPGEFTVLWDD